MGHMEIRQNFLKLAGNTSWEGAIRELAQEKSEILQGLLGSDTTFRWMKSYCYY